MCEYCIEHGEGQKWYLQMKNYAEELLYEDLSATQKELAEAETRLEWSLDFFETTVLPAMGAVTSRPSRTTDAPPDPAPPAPRQTEEELMEERKAVHFGQVLPLEDAEQVLDLVDSITRLPCGCRFFSIGKTDKRYCLGLGMDKWGILGKYPDATSSLEVLDKEEAKSIVRDYDEEGLIHTIWTGVAPYTIGLCNCDRDCMAYKRYIEEGGSARFFRGEYVAQVDLEACSGCKSCLTQCQFGAQFYSSALERVYIDPQRCFGCGLCRAACPQDAIELLPREHLPEVAELWL
jgi:NAD-dependent dihydropyrimidine dehydrogenase PreA subunit